MFCNMNPEHLGTYITQYLMTKYLLKYLFPATIKN